MSDIEQRLADIPVLRDLAAEEINVLDSYLSELWLKPGDILFKEGANEHFVGFVMQGALQVWKDNLTGRRQSIATLPKGSSIGEMALLDNLPRSATVEAKQPSMLHILRKADFAELEREHPAIAIKILKYIARTLSLNLRKASNTLSDNMLV
jgi:CRP-like cAMP-binding protein